MMEKLAKRCGFVEVLSFVFALTFGHDALAQNASKTSTASGSFYDACPPGHRVEFVIGSLSLFVDPHWLAIESETPLSQRFGANCPSQPIAVSKLYFNNLILDAANIPANLGHLNSFFVTRNESGLSPSPLSMSDLVPKDAPPLRQAAEPYVEDLTGVALRGDPHPVLPPSTRGYRLVYPEKGNEPPTFIVIACVGEPSWESGRVCSAPISYSYLGVLDVNYRFRQDHLPISEPGQLASPGTMYEPEGVLAFDTHIRAWLASLTEKPVIDGPNRTPSPSDAPRSGDVSAVQGGSPTASLPSVPEDLKYLFDLPWCSRWRFSCMSCEKIGGEIKCVGQGIDACHEAFKYHKCERYNPPKGCAAWLDGCNRCSKYGGCTLMACPEYLAPNKPSFRCLEYESDEKDRGRP